MTQYGFYFDNARCTGCRTCEMACKDFKDLFETMAFRRIFDYEGGDRTAWARAGFEPSRHGAHAISVDIQIGVIFDGCGC